VYLGGGADRGYCFVQVYDGRSGRVTHREYPLESFVAGKAAAGDGFSVGPNTFSPRGVRLAVEGEAGAVHGELHFDEAKVWPARFLSPGAMGWFAWLPWLQCYHDVLSLHHRVEGHLQVLGEAREFTGGVGYLEKTWGGAFPDAWVWLQCNQFDRPGVCLFFALARVPLLGYPLRGVTAGLLVGDDLFPFGTYRAVRVVRAEVGPDSARFRVRGLGRTLEVEAGFGRTERPADLVLAPTPAGLRPRIREVLDATVRCELTDATGKRVWAQGRGAAMDLVHPERLVG
jgi:hypothetical protein